MKLYDVCGFGSAIVDIILEVSEAEFGSLGFERGTMRLVSTDEQGELLERFKSHRAGLVSGGSVANSVIAAAQLGGKAAFMSACGDDRYGLHFASEFEELGIELANPPIVGAATGTCVSIVTPDAERTMRTSLGISAEMSAAQVSRETIERSHWLFIEGYLFASGPKAVDAIRQAVAHAKKSGCRVAVTLSESWVVDNFREPLDAVLADADLVFANEREAQSLTGESELHAAFDALKRRVPNVVVTAGPRGALISYEREDVVVDAYPCEPRDLTGAGDMFAGSFLYGVTHGTHPSDAGRCACFLAMQVITRIGARLHSGTKEFWAQALQDVR